jgi:hypothetical protein
VDKLWAARLTYEPSVAKPSKTPTESLTSIEYNFADPLNKHLLDRYRNPWERIRMGRVIEDLG